MNDREIKEFIKNNTGIIGNAAKRSYERYGGNLLDYDDFFQEGITIAMKYLKRYNPKIAKASTYIDRCVFQALTRYGDLNTFVCKMPYWISDKARSFKDFKDSLKEKGEYITEDNVAKKFKVSKTTARTFINALDVNKVDYTPLEDEDGNEYFASTSKDHIEKLVNNKLTEEYVRKMIDKLPEKEKFVLKERIYNNATFEIIGNEMGVSKQRAQQLDFRAKKKLKKFIEIDLKNNKEVLF